MAERREPFELKIDDDFVEVLRVDTRAVIAAFRIVEADWFSPGDP